MRSRKGCVLGAAIVSATVPPKAPSPFVEVPTPRCICTLLSMLAYEFMLTQKTHWSSGELSEMPSRVTFMRLAPDPLIRIEAVPVPSPFSVQAVTPGVLLSSMGNSCPVRAKVCSSFLLILLTAKGASLGTLTACTTTSFSCSTLALSASCAAAPIKLPAPDTRRESKTILFISVYL